MFYYCLSLNHLYVCLYFTLLLLSYKFTLLILFYSFVVFYCNSLNIILASIVMTIHWPSKETLNQFWELKYLLIFTFILSNVFLLLLFVYFFHIQLINIIIKTLKINSIKSNLILVFCVKISVNQSLSI